MLSQNRGFGDAFYIAATEIPGFVVVTDEFRWFLELL